MRFSLKVIPNAKKNQLKKEGAVWKVYLTAPPVEGRANKALVRFLSKEFQIAKSRIIITKGLKSRTKTVNIEGILDVKNHKNPA